MGDEEWALSLSSPRRIPPAGKRGCAIAGHLVDQSPFHTGVDSSQSPLEKVAASSLLPVSVGRSRPYAHLCGLSRCSAQSSSQQSFLGKRSASSPGAHRECGICSCSPPPSQTGAQRAPASETGRCRTAASALQAVLLSQAGAESKHAGQLGVLLGWMSPGRNPAPSYPTLRCNQSAQGGEKLSALPRRGKKLPRLFVEDGTGSRERERFTSVTLRVAGTLEKLCPQEAPRAKPLRSRGAQPRHPCPASRSSP